MKKCVFMMAACLLSGLLAVSTCEAGTDENVLLSTEKVDFDTKKIVINVGKSQGKFSRLMFQADDNDIVIHKVVVVYPGGREWQIKKKITFSDKGYPSILDLPGKKSHIKKIKLYYRPDGAKKGENTQLKIIGVR